MLPGLVLGLVLIALAFTAVDRPVAAAPAEAPPAATAQSITRLSNTPIPGAPQTNGPVLALASWGNRVVIGGSFDFAGSGTGPLVRTAMADGSPQTAPTLAGTIHAMIEDGAGGWLVAGELDGPDLLRVLPDGSLDPAWALRVEPVGSGTGVPRGWINSLVLDGTTLYVGGYFSGIGPEGAPVHRGNLAAIDTTTRTVLPWNPNLNPLVGPVTAVVRSGDRIVASGSVLESAAGTRNGLAAFDLGAGAMDLTFNPGIAGGVNAILAGSDGDLWIGGDFQTVGGQNRRGVARLSAQGVLRSWQGDVFGGAVHTLALAADRLYVGGAFGGIQGQTRRAIGAMRTDADTGNLLAWNPLLPQGSVVTAIAPAGTQVYLSGTFLATGWIHPSVVAEPVARLARVSAATAERDLTWGPGLGAPARVLVPSGSDLWIGGEFGQAFGGLRHGLAAIDASTRTLLPLGQVVTTTFDAAVEALLVLPDGDLVAGGRFNFINATFRRHLARYAPDGSLRPDDFGVTDSGGTASPSIRGLAVDGDRLIVAGLFTRAAGNGGEGDVARGGMAAFDLADPARPVVAGWNPGPLGTLLHVDGPWLFVGGQQLHKISIASAQPDPGFSPFLPRPVTALALHDGILRVGWEVSSLPTLPSLSAVNPATGAELGWQPGTNGGAEVTGLAVRGNNLLVGGRLFELAGSPRNRLGAVPLTGTGRPADPWHPTILPPPIPARVPAIDNRPMPIASFEQVVVAGPGPLFYEAVPVGSCLFGPAVPAAAGATASSGATPLNGGYTSALPVVLRACAGAW